MCWVFWLICYLFIGYNLLVNVDGWDFWVFKVGVLKNVDYSEVCLCNGRIKEGFV